ncbi:MAG TPA: VWA domain-containing protein [Longimicrobiaceae bacterium]|nr:VWA domain-containing protein [Longimicrobiaceae bacterium]
MDITFGRPYWLLAILLLAVGARWLWRRAAPGIAHARAHELASGAGGWARWMARAPNILRFMVLVLLVLALAGPRTSAGVVEEAVQGVPTVIAIDLSSSMLERDLGSAQGDEDAGPTRLTLAKNTVARFISGRASDPIGLVAFAANALTVVPLTTQKRVLLSALESLEVGLLEDGTALGEGLATAANRLRDASGKSKVVILMSDGESNRGVVDPLVAAQAAAAFGIRVYTVGVGSETAGVDESLLREIAATTGGEYFRATDAQALSAIYDRIDALVEVPVQTRQYVEYTNWHLPIVLLASCILLGEWFLRGSRWGVVP